MRVRRQRQKGRSLLAFPDDFTVVDLETTGMTYAYGDFLEIACVKFRGSVEVARYTTLVRPPSGRVPRFITELTGITAAMVADAPAFREVAADVWRFLEGELIVGYNVNFDVNFLYDAFEELDGSLLQNDFVDAYRIARRVLPKLARRRLVDLCDYYQIQTIHHRALADCDSTQKVLAALKETAAERGVVLNPERRGRSKPVQRRLL